jgi:hypothetical protein
MNAPSEAFTVATTCGTMPAISNDGMLESLIVAAD